MKFHHKIIAAALGFSLIVAGARVLAGGPDVMDDLTDPGFWVALGENLVGAQVHGWCRCS